MNLMNMASPSPWGFAHLPKLPKLPSPKPNHTPLSFISLLLSTPTISSFSQYTPPSPLKPRASSSSSSAASSSSSSSLSSELVSLVASTAKEGDEALGIIAETCGRSSGIVSVPDCCSLIAAAISRNNSDLAFSLFHSMRSSSSSSVPPPGMSENGTSLERWKWPRPDAKVYACLVLGLAALLKVSDALRMIDYVCRAGASPGEEMPFGKVLRCPTCLIAVAVAQPQQGIQIASCAKCRYQYELVSGDVISMNSEEISMDLPAWKRGLRFLQLMKQSVPAAVHSIVVQTPSGVARTHRFATETVDLPAQEGERVTIAAAAPSSVYRNVGPLKVSPKAPNLYPGEPMCLTNHKDGRESVLLRAPAKEGKLSLLNPSVLVPFLAVLATGDAASGMIDPSLPQLLSVAAVASLGIGATLNVLVLPQLNQLPQRSVDSVAIKQQLLSQYDVLQSRIKGLKEATEKEVNPIRLNGAKQSCRLFSEHVWILARMCQLENKIFAVGEPSYRARRTRVKRVREALESSISSRIELIDSYARISSMIEIEVEMDSDVLVAEAVSTMESISEQIEQIMELENLEKRWRLQAEANDEAERLLSQPAPTETM